ncbi:MAG: hypothetical protein ABFD89_10385 [Bryobacteraceae bacterium]
MIDKSSWESRMAELDRLIASEPPEQRKRPGPKPGQCCDRTRKRAELDRVAARMREKYGPRSRRLAESAANARAHWGEGHARVFGGRVASVGGGEAA